MNGIVNKVIEVKSSSDFSPHTPTSLNARPYGTTFDISQYNFMSITGLSYGYLYLFPKAKWGYSNSDGILTGTVRYTMSNNASVVYTINFEAQTLTSSSSEYTSFICF